ncbi:MAG: glycosyltransferase family 4 protein, partial [Armatimonadota bacterium]
AEQAAGSGLPGALLPRPGPLVEMLLAVDCPVHVIEPPPPLGSFGRRLIAAGLRERAAVGRALIGYSWTLARWLRAERVDLLHCNQTRAVVEAGPAGRLAGVPVVWNVRIRERLPRSVIRLCDECADVIIPLTERDFAGLADEQHLLSRSTIITNAVDTERFSFSGDDLAARARLGVGGGALVLTAGVLVPRKGFDVLIRAMAQVVRDHPDALLFIAGDEPDMPGGCRAELEALIGELGAQERVRLLGHREDMPDLLAACDVFVLASHLEGDPAVVLEAMATGRPVVASAPAASAVQQDITGVVVPDGDADACARAISGLLANPARARRMGESARRVAEARYDIRVMVRRYEAAWGRLVS